MLPVGVQEAKLKVAARMSAIMEAILEASACELRKFMESPRKLCIELLLSSVPPVRAFWDCISSLSGGPLYDGDLGLLAPGKCRAPSVCNS